LVAFMVLETWVITSIEAIDSGSDSSFMPNNLNLLRILRLARLTRMTRLMRAFPQMLTLVKGIVAAMRSVFFTLLLLSILMYIFAIIFTSTYKGNPDSGGAEEEGSCPEDPTPEEALIELFGSIGSSIQTLLLSGTLLDDLSDVMSALRQDNTMFLLIFVVFIVLSSFLVLNMMIGILFEVVYVTKEAEEYKMKINTVTEVMGTTFESIDKDKSGKISEKEFEAMCLNPDVMETLQSELEIEPEQLKEMAPLLFSEEHGKELSFGDFMTLLVRHRPGEEAGPIDIEDFRKLIRMQEKMQFAKLKNLKGSFLELTRSVDLMNIRLQELERERAPSRGSDADSVPSIAKVAPDPVDAVPSVSVEQAAVSNASDDRLLDELTKRLPNIDVAALMEV